MKNIKWDSSFSVGIETLDDQHKQFVKLINVLANTEAETVSKEEILEILDQLKEYASLHFDAEETLMEELEYPKLISHIGEHAEFMPMIYKFYLLANDYDQNVQDELLEFLTVWLTRHILESDMQYKPYFDKLLLEKTTSK